MRRSLITIAEAGSELPKLVEAAIAVEEIMVNRGPVVQLLPFPQQISERRLMSAM
jgi:hypothetical protein